ncbi:ubiquitinyl hydrolase 1 [Malassezia yamatoensis]|uniref:ubiquitinyl hydrolase 1 n=1 Tax=Malassezia yamatoensis TaxID=253288 RepID=A0AAJ6CHF3_9BASI|nr:ubiquitinyl hydrolase 1 [Malassezia yamatoensis]
MALDLGSNIMGLTYTIGTVILRPIRSKETVSSQPRRRRRGTAPRFFKEVYKQYGQDAGPLPMDAAVTTFDKKQDPDMPHYLGLYNPNVYCFMNSVVQSLASIKALAHFLDALTDMAERYDAHTPVTDVLREMFIVLNTPQKRRGALAPKQLVQVLSGVSQSQGMRSLISAHQQQDAQELALLIIQSLDQELGSVQHQRAVQLENQSRGLRGATAPSTLVLGHLRTSLGHDGDDVVNPFSGLSAQRTSCIICGYMEAIRYFSFSDLSLAVPMGVRACTLEQCLQTWSQLEQIEWVCHRCSIRATLSREQANLMRLKSINYDTTKVAEHIQRLNYVLNQGLHESEVSDSAILDGIPLVREPSDQSTKQVMLARAPRILMIHLNRSSYAYGSLGATKNHTRIAFPEVLDMTPYTTGSVLSTSPTEALSDKSVDSCVYRLSALVTHYGGHHSGHYVAFRRRANDQWTRISDDSVESCSIADVLVQNPYLLFYELKSKPSKIPLIQAVPHARLVHSWDTSRTTSRESTPLRS